MKTLSRSHAAVGGLLLVVLIGVSVGAYRYIRVQLSRQHRQDLIARSSGVVRTRGFLNRLITDDDGTRHRYMLFVPHAMADDDRLPVMVYLNGFGENGDDAIMPMYNGLAMAIREYEQTFPMIVVWPQCETGDSWTTDGRSRARAISILKHVQSEFHSDPECVYLTGISSGGTGTWAIAAAHSDLFAAAVPCSAVASPEDVDQIAESGLPVWSYSVAGDDESVVSSTREAHQRLLEQGCSPHFTELPTEGDSAYARHNSWDFAYRDEGLYRWLASQKRSDRTATLDRFERVASDQMPSRISRPQSETVAGAPGKGPEIEGSSNMDKQPLRILSGLSSSGLVEVQLEIRPTAGVSGFGIGFFAKNEGANSDGAWIKLSTDRLACSGVYCWPQGHCLAASTLPEPRGVRIGVWNDLRITLGNDHISAEMNGLPAFHCSGGNVNPAESVVGFVLDGNADAAVELQNVSVRRLAAEGSQREVAVAGSSTRCRELPQEPVADAIDLNRIEQAWQTREKQFPYLDLSWVQEGERRFAAARFHQVGPQKAESPVEPSGRLKLSPTATEYSAGWLHSLTDFWRRSDVPSETELEAYKRAMDLRFRIPVTSAPGSLMMTVYCTGDRRIATVSAPARGIHRVVLEQSSAGLGNRAGVAEEAMWRAPLLAFRPLSSSGIGCQIANCRLLHGDSMVSGRRCVVIEEAINRNDQSMTRRLWADPSRGFLILKECVTLEGGFDQQIDVAYSLNQEQQWIPSSWTVQVQPAIPSPILGDGFPGARWVVLTSSAKIIDCREADSALIGLSDDAFPEGAIIYDKTNKEWFQQVSNDQRITPGPADIRKLTSGDD